MQRTELEPAVQAGILTGAQAALGVVWQRREKEWSGGLRTILPAALRELIEARASR